MKKIESVGELFGVVATTAKNHGANVQSWKPNGSRVDLEMRGAFVGVLSVLQRLEVAGERTRVEKLDVKVSREGEMNAHCKVSLIAPTDDVPETHTARRFESLAKVIPREAWLVVYRDEAGKIDIEGRAASLAQLTELMSNLKTSKLFAEVAIAEAEKTKERNDLEVVTFKLTAKAST